VAIGGQQLLGGDCLGVLPAEGDAALHVVLAGGDRAGGFPKQPRVRVDGLLAATWGITCASSSSSSSSLDGHHGCGGNKSKGIKQIGETKENKTFKLVELCWSKMLKISFLTVFYKQVHNWDSGWVSTLRENHKKPSIIKCFLCLKGYKIIYI